MMTEGLLEETCSREPSPFMLQDVQTMLQYRSREILEAEVR